MYKIVFLCKLFINKLATNIYNLETKIFPLITSWLPNEKVNFEPWENNLVLVKCLDIMSDHNVKLAGHIQNLVGQCPMTDCYF